MFTGAHGGALDKNIKTVHADGVVLVAEERQRRRASNDSDRRRVLHPDHTSKKSTVAVLVQTAAGQKFYVKATHTPPARQQLAIVRSWVRCGMSLFQVAPWSEPDEVKEGHISTAG